MKRAFVFLGAATLLTSNAFAQADVIIKKRAQEIRDQNNVRQSSCPSSSFRIMAGIGFLMFFVMLWTGVALVPGGTRA